MKRTRILFLSLLLVGLAGLLMPAVRQVRVKAERAAVYLEPSRNSTRIDIVRKGALLNLFQEEKVKDVWYYISYESSRYGGRMSGFILDSAVELVTDGEPAPPKPVPPTPKTEVEEKAEEPAPQPKKAPQPQKPPDTPKTAPPPVPSKIAPALTPTAPAKAEPSPAAVPETPKEKPEIVRVSSVTVLTPMPGARRMSLPRRPAPVLQDAPWAVIQPPAPVPEKVQAPAPALPTAAKVDAAKAKAKPSTAPPAKEKPPAKTAPPAAEPAKSKPVEHPPAPSPAASAPQAKPSQPVRLPAGGPRPARLSVGLGYGPSFGGAGGSFQLYLSRTLAIHAGYGIYPTNVIYSETDWVTNETLWSAGLRLYLMPRAEKLTPYLDAQYGGLGVQAAQVITGIYDFSYIYSNEQKVLWGPSLLAGLEVRFGHFVLSGGLGASYSLTEWEYLESRVFFAFEAGLGVRL